MLFVSRCYVRWPFLILPCMVAGCSIAARSDKFGASLDVGVGGIAAYIADVHVKADVGFSKTCNHKEETDGQEAAIDNDPLGVWGFL